MRDKRILRTISSAAHDIKEALEGDEIRSPKELSEVAPTYSAYTLWALVELITGLTKGVEHAKEDKPVERVRIRD